MAVGQLLSPFLLAWLIYHEVATLVERYDLIQNGSNRQPSRNSVVVPIVPGVNLAPDYLWAFWSCTLVVLAIHELGHAVAASLEHLNIQGCGVFFAAVFPGAYVRVKETVKYIPLISQLRVYSAGILNNVISIIILLWMWWSVPFVLNSTFYRAPLSPVTGSIGVAVTRVSPNSLVSNHLWPGCVITSINGHKVMSRSNAMEVIFSGGNDSLSDQYLVLPSSHEHVNRVDVRKRLRGQLDKLADVELSEERSNNNHPLRFAGPVSLSRPLCLKRFRAAMISPVKQNSREGDRDHGIPACCAEPFGLISSDVNGVDDAGTMGCFVLDANLPELFVTESSIDRVFGDHAQVQSNLKDKFLCASTKDVLTDNFDRTEGSACEGNRAVRAVISSPFRVYDIEYFAPGQTDSAHVLLETYADELFRMISLDDHLPARLVFREYEDAVSLAKQISSAQYQLPEKIRKYIWLSIQVIYFLFAVSCWC